MCRIDLTPGPAPDAAIGVTPDAAGGTAPDAMSGPVPEPCASAPCGPGTCMPAGDGYRCACNPGYVSDEQPGGETCVVASAVRAEGTIHTCLVQDGLLEAFYRRGTTTRLLVCQYDIDLGFVFDTVRVSGGTDRLELVSLAATGSVTDVTSLLAQPWGQNVTANLGDVVLGSAAHPGPVLSLGAALGLASGAIQSFAPGAFLVWPRETIAVTTTSTVLRLHLTENGSEEEAEAVQVLVEIGGAPRRLRRST